MRDDIQRDIQHDAENQREAQAGENAARTDAAMAPADADALPLASTDINAGDPQG